MDLFEVAGLALWVFIIFVVPALKKKRGKKQGERQYPDIPEETSAKDVSEEERKLKEWLENVFGKRGDAGNEEEYAEDEKDEYEENDDEDDDEVRSPPPVVQPRPAFVASAGGQPDTGLDCVALSQEYTGVSGKKNPWRGRIGKNQMAYGMIMAEVFAKPRALRPVEINAFTRKKTPRYSGAEVRPVCR